jgi:NAD(P)-dependent dehydrogenase (short-subunit alcohol dehydrogenase family)
MSAFMPEPDSRPLDQLISLHGKTAIVTGAAAGIGRAIALRVAEAGADLELVDINAEQLDLLQTEVASYGTSVNVHAVDVSQRSEIEAFWLRLGDASPDILVNNAGIYPLQPFLEIDDDDLERVLRVNLKSAFWMCQELIRRRQNTGGIHCQCRVD